MMYFSIPVLLVACCVVIQGAIAVPISNGGDRIRIIYGNQSFDTVVADIFQETVSNVKEIVSQLLGIPAEEQTLVFQSEEMQNNKDLYDYGVQKNENPVLFVAKREDQIGQKRMGKVTVLQGKTSYFIDTPIQENTTCTELKDILSKTTGWDAEDIDIEFNGRNLNGGPLKRYGVGGKKWPVLSISRTTLNETVPGDDDGPGYDFTLVVQHGDGHFSMIVSRYERVKMIRERLETATGLSDTQLSFRGAEIHDTHTPADHEINANYSDEIVFLSQQIEK